LHKQKTLAFLRLVYYTYQLGNYLKEQQTPEAEMEKKKRRLNVVDIVVIVAVVAVIAIIAQRYLSRPETGFVETARIEFEVTVIGVQESIADFVAGDNYPAQMISANSYVNGWVESAPTVADAEAVHEQLKLGEQTVRVTPTQPFKTVTFKCYAVVPAADAATQLGTQEIRIGRTFTVKTLNTELTGMITDYKRITGKDAQ
jgi:hypothetical protein